MMNSRELAALEAAYWARVAGYPGNSRLRPILEVRDGHLYDAAYGLSLGKIDLPLKGGKFLLRAANIDVREAWEEVKRKGVGAAHLVLDRVMKIAGVEFNPRVPNPLARATSG